MIQYTQEEIHALDKYYTPPNNLVTLFEEAAEKYADVNLFGTKNKKTGVFEWITYGEVRDRANKLRGGLAKIGLEKGQAIGVIVSNSPEWFIIEQACHGLGGRFVAMYEKELEQTWKYIIRDSELRYLFVRDKAIYDKVSHYVSEIPTLQDVYIIHGDGEKSMARLEDLGAQFPVPSYKPHWSEISNLVYTSGTTGHPKGVLLTHGNLTHCSQSGYEIFPSLVRGSVSLAILPWAHAYGLSAELHNFIQFGGSLGIMESVDTLADDLLAVRPTYLIAVPRIFNKIYNGIMAKMKESGGFKKKLFDAACAEAVRLRGSGKSSLKMKILDKLVFSKIRARFGSRIQGVMTASAIMNPNIAMFFRDIGVPTFDCYGLTETGPAITMNSPLRGNKYGTVGRTVRDMHVVIDRSRVGDESQDGEVLAYGAHVMMGYFKKPEKSAEILLPDRWNGFPGIRTGDLGRIDEEGYLYITGRFKDEYKLSNGKYVHPEAIENSIKLLQHVINAFVYGDGKAYNVCVVVPDFEAVAKDVHLEKWHGIDPPDLVQDDSFKEYFSDMVTEHLRDSFARYEIPKKFLVVAENFTLENGMLTQTMKVKRNEVLSKYSTEIQKLYD